MLKVKKKYVFLSLIFLALFSCQKKEEPMKRMNISFNMDPRTLDSRKSGDIASSAAIFLLFNGLTEITSKGTVDMALAESYDLSADQKTYVFHLREAKWSDGHKITAFDFEKSWKKILDPNFPALCPQLFYCIKNAEKAKEGKVAPEDIGVYALDEKTLIVHLANPTPYFLSLVSFCIFYPLPSHIEEKNLWPSQGDEKIITSGPFILKKWNHNDEIILMKNPSYWNAKNIKLDEIHISIIRSETTALQMFENGQLDWVGAMLSPLPVDSMATILKRKELQISPVAATTFCAFNVEKFPFSNKNMRKAFGLAINRKTIVQNITQGKEEIATRCIPPILMKNKNISYYEDNDVQEAKEYFNKGLQELNIKKEDLKITFSYGSGILHKKLAEALQEGWARAFDISVQMEQIEEKVMLDRMHKHDFQAALSHWLVQYNDPMNILSRFKNKNNVKNYPLWENSTYIQLLDYSATLQDKELRIQLLEKAEEIFLEEMPVSPIYHHNYITLTNPCIKGISIGPVGDIHFDKAQIVK